jgi:hypothetical protein
MACAIERQLSLRHRGIGRLYGSGVHRDRLDRTQHGPAILRHAVPRRDQYEGTTNAFLDSFLRGNRDDQPRRSDGSILQALNLMNASLIEGKLALTGATPAR